MLNFTAPTSADKKVTEQFRTIRLLFRRLRLLVERCNELGHLGSEPLNIEALIPLKDEPDAYRSDLSQNEEYKKLLQENRELNEAVANKNKQLRDIIDRVRIIIWEINSMLSMRKS